MIIDFDNSVLEKTYNNLTILCRDLHMGDSGREYIPGKFMTEKEMLLCSSDISGFTCDTRFLIFSNIADLDPYLDCYVGMNLYVLDNFSYFKIIDNFSDNGIRQITLLHICPERIKFFKEWNEYDESIKKLAREIMEKSLQSDINDKINSKLWKGICSFPIGMDEDMEFYSLDLDECVNISDQEG